MRRTARISSADVSSKNIYIYTEKNRLSNINQIFWMSIVNCFVLHDLALVLGKEALEITVPKMIVLRSVIVHITNEIFSPTKCLVSPYQIVRRGQKIIK